MTDLSPAAQAVLDAYKDARDGQYVNGEWIQDEAGQVAAALRAAADHCAEGATHWALYAIAAELEGNHTSENVYHPQRLDPLSTVVAVDREATLPDEDDAPWLDCMDGFKASIEGDESPVPAEPMTDLRTLDDHNRSALEAFTLSNGPCPNGIACPECGRQVRSERTLPLCSRCWKLTPDGKASDAERQRRRRSKPSAP